MIWIFSFFFIGIILQYIIPERKKWVRRINTFIMYLPLPAVTIINISKLQIDTSLLLPILSAWAMYIVGLLFFGFFYILKYIDKKTFACLALVCGLGNTSFIGYPLITVLLAKEQLKHAVLVDQPGTFLALSTIGIVTASIAQKGSFSILYIFRRLFTFPPFIAFCIGLIVPKSWYGLHLLDISCMDIFQFFGSMLIPFALLSLGLQFSIKKGKYSWREFALGISYKSIIGPMLFVLYIYLSQHLPPSERLLTIALELAMPPMITASIVADEFELRPDLANALAILGIPFGIVAVVGWWLLLVS